VSTQRRLCGIPIPSSKLCPIRLRQELQLRDDIEEALSEYACPDFEYTRKERYEQRNANREKQNALLG
jgi:hypothetical protein